MGVSRIDPGALGHLSPLIKDRDMVRRKCALGELCLVPQGVIGREEVATKDKKLER